MDMFETVKEILARQLQVDADDITQDTDIVDDLGADSLDVVEMLMSLEDNFNIQVEDEEAANLLTVSAIVEYIENAKK